MSFDCKQEQAIKIILDLLKEIKEDIKEVKEFKDRFFGAVLVISGIFSMLVSILIRYFFS